MNALDLIGRFVSVGGARIERRGAQDYIVGNVGGKEEPAIYWIGSLPPETTARKHKVKDARVVTQHATMYGMDPNELLVPVLSSDLNYFQPGEAVQTPEQIPHALMRTPGGSNGFPWLLAGGALLFILWLKR